MMVSEKRIGNFLSLGMKIALKKKLYNITVDNRYTVDTDDTKNKLK